MRTLIIIATIVVLVLGLGACSRDETPTAVAPVPATGNIDKDGGGSGAQVVRYQDALAIIYTDEVRGLQLIVGVDVEEYCTLGLFPDIIDIMEITNPVDQVLVVQLIRSKDVHAAVYPLYDFDCARMLDEGPIAVGTADFLSVDNDLYAWYDTNDASRVNSATSKVNGTLYTPDGQKVLLNFTWKLIWPGYPDFDQIRLLKSDIVLTFTGS